MFKELIFRPMRTLDQGFQDGSLTFDYGTSLEKNAIRLLHGTAPPFFLSADRSASQVRARAKKKPAIQNSHTKLEARGEKRKPKSKSQWTTPSPKPALPRNPILFPPVRGPEARSSRGSRGSRGSPASARKNSCQARQSLSRAWRRRCQTGGSTWVNQWVSVSAGQQICQLFGTCETDPNQIKWASEAWDPNQIIQNGFTVVWNL